MNPPDSPRERIIHRIVDLEWKMFSTVKAREPAACQEEEGTFRLMRWMSHSVYSDLLLDMLASHLETATTAGRNLMTEKYARMEDLIPPLRTSPLIPYILAAETAWMADLGRRYPLTFPGTGERFGAYLAAELETWPEDALERYAAEVGTAQATGANLVEARYTNLFRRLGDPDLEAREHRTRLGMFRCAQ
ncbi:DUF4125 family protein [Mesoterricola sediminis]|uniref:DUF4125 family protein n=1 Tax=Mesoterricola sediminis TaxID=2927980 RepID=A0AA48GMS2_9BACT|nr:DUF4125 family protein [Mesoterricola sediminis]BDU75956.1 hypothetical protein METESE_09140 [Mesoterricola sediminis]